MKRREFIAGLGGAATMPFLARAQERRVVAFLHSGSQTPPHDGFSQGLADAGYVDGRNITIERRYAEGRYDRLTELASELVQRGVAVICAAGGAHTAIAVKKTSPNIPIVFSIGSDPVKFGLVTSLNHPGGNITGVSFFTAELEPKRLGLLHSVVPQAKSLGALINPNNANATEQARDLTAAARTLGAELHVLHATSEGEIEAAFVALLERRCSAIVIASDSFFAGRQAEVVSLAARHTIPAIYEWREFVDHGGLMSYGPNLTETYRQAGLYTARILHGDKPADIPVTRATKFEFILNMKTAKALGLVVPTSMQLLADEVIE